MTAQRIPIVAIRWEDERTTCGRVHGWLAAHDYAPDAQPTPAELPGDCDMCIGGRCDINGREFTGPCLGRLPAGDPAWARAMRWRLTDDGAALRPAGGA
jgi:hypothetical protein